MFSHQTNVWMVPAERSVFSTFGHVITALHTLSMLSSVQTFVLILSSGDPMFWGSEIIMASIYIYIFLKN